MAPTPASTAKATYAVTLVIQWRFSCSSCLRPICFSSACRFLSRLSVLMIRLRASSTSLRRRFMSPASCDSARGGTDLDVLVSSAICLMLHQRAGSPRASHGAQIDASFSSTGRSVRVWRVALFLGLQEMDHQPQREEVAAHVEVLG